MPPAVISLYTKWERGGGLASQAGQLSVIAGTKMKCYIKSAY